MVKVSDDVGVAAFHITPYLSAIVPNLLIVPGIVRHAIRVRFLQKRSSRTLCILSVVCAFANIDFKILQMVTVDCMIIWLSFIHILDNQDGILDVAMLQVNTDDHDMTLGSQLNLTGFEAGIESGRCVQTCKWLEIISTRASVNVFNQVLCLKCCQTDRGAW